MVISYRSDYDKARADLDRLGITYDDVVLVDSFEAKADVIAEYRINVYIDDQAEMLKNIPEHDPRDVVSQWREFRVRGPPLAVQ